MFASTSLYRLLSSTTSSTNNVSNVVKKTSNHQFINRLTTTHTNHIHTSISTSAYSPSTSFTTHFRVRTNNGTSSSTSTPHQHQYQQPSSSSNIVTSSLSSTHGHGDIDTNNRLNHTFSSTSSASSLNDISTHIRSLYRSFIRSVPAVLQSYNISKTNKHDAVQHVRYEWIHKHNEMTMNHHSSTDVRYMRVLLHRATILLYDLQHGYKTRREVKQLLCGQRSCNDIPVEAKISSDIVSYANTYKQPNSGNNNTASTSTSSTTAYQQFDSVTTQDVKQIFHPQQHSSQHVV